MEVAILMLATLRALIIDLETLTRQADTYEQYLVTALQSLVKTWPDLQHYDIATLKDIDFVEPRRQPDASQDGQYQWLVPVVAGPANKRIITFNWSGTPDAAEATWEAVQIWANSVGHVWQNVRWSTALDTSIFRRLELFEQLSVVVQRVWAELAEEEVLNAACQSIVEAVEDVDRVGIVLNDNAPISGTVVAGYPSDVVGQQLELEDYWVYEQMQKNQSPIVVNNVAEAEAELGANRELLMQFGVRSILILPLVVQNKLIGSLGLDAIQNTHEFTDIEVDVLSAIASQIAISLQNARLFESLQDRARSQEIVNRVLENLPLRSDVSTLLNTTGQQVGNMLGATHFRIHLGASEIE